MSKKHALHNTPLNAATGRMRPPRLLLYLLGAVFLGAAALYFFLPRPFSKLNPQKDDGLMENDLNRLSEESYDSVLLSMHSTEGFSQDDFAYYRGLNTLVASHAILNTDEFSEYLDCIISSGNEVTNLYLCLDPELLWTGAGQKEEQWNADLGEGLYTWMEANPGIFFEVLLPYPYISYWTSLDENRLDALLTVYQTLVTQLSAFPNTKIYFPGFEDWITVNPDNYAGSLFDANEIITQKLFLYTFCDGVYRITPNNEENFWGPLRESIRNAKGASHAYPDLSRWHIVFFGDSVLANYPGSYAIPGYMAGLSHITYDNCAIGGTCAAHTFPAAADAFLSAQAEQPAPEADKKLCFLINYGINDYFTGGAIENPLDPYDESTYKGSLRAGISRLLEAFPEADCIIMTPTHISFFENGTMVMSEEGAVFDAYIEAAREISREMDLYLIDNYLDPVITPENLAEYITDGVHPNEKGRLEIALRIMDFLNRL